MFALRKSLAVKSIGVGLLSVYLSARPLSATSAGLFSQSLCEDNTNPLLKNRGTPLFSQIKPVHVVPAVEASIEDLKSGFQAFEKEIEQSKAHDYPTVVERLETLNHPLSFSWGVVSHLMGVKNSDDLRKAYEEIQPRVVASTQQLGQSQSLYRALTELESDSTQWSALDEAQQRIVLSSIRSMRNSGVGLQGEEKERFNKLQQEFAELSTKFSNNLLDSTKEFKLVLTNKADVDGLSPSALALAAKQAVGAGHESATAELGPWVVTLDLPSYLPAMQHLKNRGLREQLYRAYTTRASRGEKDNAPIIQRILQIRRELAQLLGYKNHAEKSLSAKMAPDVDTVLNLIDMLQRESYPAAQKDLADVKAHAAAHGFTDELAVWDLNFWSERLREASYQFSEEELRPYFALPVVLKGMFALANRLFGITIVAADGEAEVWHEDVRYFRILDSRTGEHLANFFLDPYSRPAEKRGGAWMNTCIGKSKVMNSKPVAYLVCNGSPPIGDSPSLMTFREVETLFHEFGHGLQHMLTTVDHFDASGINNIEWDAVELPSQFMENWCYDRPTLNEFAKHYQTGEPIPEELFNKITAAKNYQAGLMMLRQLFFGALDMQLHSVYDPRDPSVSPFDVQRELAPKYTVIPPLPEDRFLCGFAHIFAGGYSAGYYSYKWAEVMSADAFAAFEEAGLDDEGAVQRIGRRFRDTVLSKGGGRHPSLVFRDFRGRDPSPAALLRHSGLGGKHGKGAEVANKAQSTSSSVSTSTEGDTTTTTTVVTTTTTITTTTK